MTLRRASHSLRVLLSLALLYAAAARPARPQESAPPEGKSPAPPGSAAVTFGTLDEIRGKRRVRLLVIRPQVVDAGDPTQGVAAAVLDGGEAERRLGEDRWLRRAHDNIARTLNKYIRKYRSMTSARLEEADYFVVFNLLRLRRTLNGIYPRGEMYVVTYAPRGPVRVLWRTEKEMFDEDAAKKLIEALKAMRGEN